MEKLSKQFEEHYTYKYFSYIAIYISIVAFLATTVIFALNQNAYIGKIFGIGFILTFLFTQLLYTSKKYYINSFIVVYFLFMCYGLLSVFWTVDVFYTTFTARRVFLVLINLIILYNVFKLYNNIYTAIFIGLAIGIIYNVLLSLNIIHVGYELYKDGSERFRGSTFQPNALAGIAVYTIMGAMLLLDKAKNIIWIAFNIIIILLSIYIIMLTMSRTALIMAIMLISLLLIRIFLDDGYKKYRVYIISSIVIAIVIAPYYINLDTLINVYNGFEERLTGLIEGLTSNKGDSSTSERFVLIKMTIEIIKNNPFFGIGLDTVRVSLFKGLYSHNNYLELLACLGPIGFLLFYTLHIITIKKILAIKDGWLKIYLLFFIFIIMISDMAGVTYYSKYMLFYMLLFNHLAEDNVKINYKS
jgi:O-antigen ligase